MYMKSMCRILMATSILLLIFIAEIQAQGVSRQDYSGLDKYLSQGRNPDASFAGVRAAEFLTIPVGARAIGMGSAYSSVADDISSIWWNPAGLGFLQQREIMLTVVDFTMDLTYSFGAVAAPLADGNIVLGVLAGYLNVPETEITTVESPDGTGRFYSAYDFQMGGALAYNLSDRFVAGLNVKYIHQDVLSNVGGNAFAIDAGAIYHTDLADREIRFAFAIQNLGTNITMNGPYLLKKAGPLDREGQLPDGYGDFSSDDHAFSRRGGVDTYIRTHTYRLPTAVKIGLAYCLITNEIMNWIVSGELWRNSNMPVSYSAGTELTYNFNSAISASLRSGWKIQTDEFTEDYDQFGYSYLGDNPKTRGLSLGGGLKRDFAGRFIEFSYAYRNKGRLSADNFFTLTFGF